MTGGWRDDGAMPGSARGDRQHAAVLAGDMRLGVYGSYPPAV